MYGVVYDSYDNSLPGSQYQPPNLPDVEYGTAYEIRWLVMIPARMKTVYDSLQLNGNGAIRCMGGPSKELFRTAQGVIGGAPGFLYWK
ncbi:predicted protein [Sclerotinia sclerotiorum 1980 UF-70]|uniref:Uncharacterized protein n=1 Tax=Sclerotinia sclerotiorum (strain ATCC 18683 / 1980 / Ss-1) TaxID=665079 RepID=A7F6F5_SCLS1|nr:predicted protein [Sclerotinia sclerotiorum 1980 UF-70]EDN98326.1 predicted protein [Sclerotinia sclerotiorum 1980 UF-70]